jgi:hypothetical protein
VTVLLAERSCTSLSPLREAHPASHSMLFGVLSPGVKRPGREADHQLPSSFEVKNEWIYTSASSIRLHGVDEVIFTFTSIIKFQFVQHAESRALKLVKPVGFALVMCGEKLHKEQKPTAPWKCSVVRVKKWAEQRCCAFM